MFDNDESLALPAGSYLHREHVEAMLVKAAFWAASSTLAKLADAVDRLTVTTSSAEARNGAEAMRQHVADLARQHALKWMREEVSPAPDLMEHGF